MTISSAILSESEDTKGRVGRYAIDVFEGLSKYGDRFDGNNGYLKGCPSDLKDEMI
jgi:hypothetical protein